MSPLIAECVMTPKKRNFIWVNYDELYGYGPRTGLRKALWEEFDEHKLFDSYVYIIIKDYEILKIGSSKERCRNAKSVSSLRHNQPQIGKYFLQRVPLNFRITGNPVSEIREDKHKCKIWIYFIDDDPAGYKCQEIEYRLKWKYYKKHGVKPKYDKN